LELLQALEALEALEVPELGLKLGQTGVVAERAAVRERT
jgi:hypothetical protein